MVGRKKITNEDLLDNIERYSIINCISNTPKSISQIEKELKINRGNLKHHINLLCRAGYVEKEQQTNSVGKPVLISLTKKIEQPLKQKFEEHQKYNHNLEKLFLDIKPEHKKIVEEGVEKLKKEMDKEK